MRARTTFRSLKSLVPHNTLPLVRVGSTVQFCPAAPEFADIVNHISALLLSSCFLSTFLSTPLQAIRFDEFSSNERYFEPWLDVAANRR